MPLAEKVRHLLKNRQVGEMLYPQSFRDGENDLLRVLQHGERHKTDPIGEISARLPGHLDAQPRFADSTHAGKSFLTTWHINASPTDQYANCREMQRACQAKKMNG